MLTVKEVAVELCVSATCVYQLISSGKLTCHRIGVGRGAIRIAETDLAAFIDKCRYEKRPDRPTASHKPADALVLKHLRLNG